MLNSKFQIYKLTEKKSEGAMVEVQYLPSSDFPKENIIKINYVLCNEINL